MAKERKKAGKQDVMRAKAGKSAKAAKVGHDSSPGAGLDGPGAFGPDDRPKVAVTVDVVVLALNDGALSVLLVERGREPQRGSWALPGTVVDGREPLVAAAARAVVGRTGVTVAPERLEQLSTFADPDRDPRTRVVTVGLVAVVERATPPAGGAVASGRWWPIDKLLGKKSLQLAFDHRAILEAGVEQVAEDLEWSDLAVFLVEEPFTLGDLRRAYEAVWGTPLEPANFRRKVLATPGFVKATGRRRAVTTGRPAELYLRGGGGRLQPPLIRVD